MSLLVGYTDHLRELLLRQARHDPTLANAETHMPVHVVGALVLWLVVLMLMTMAHVRYST